MRTWPALRVSGLATDPSFPETPTVELLQAVLTDFGVAAIEERSADEWQVCFASAADRHAAARDVAERFPSLELTQSDVQDEDWALRSQASLQAVRVGTLLVAPPWDAHPHDGLSIVIQPSMGFGTGHHATTRLCLAALQ